jgi:hypothetical protein
VNIRCAVNLLEKKQMNERNEERKGPALWENKENTRYIWFFVHFTKLFQLHCQIIKWFVSAELEEIWKEADVAYSKGLF